MVACIFLMICCCTVSLHAQPLLPSIQCISSSDSVSVSWQCHFPSVKAISVARSSDSIKGYTIIGQPASLLPGFHSFTDYNAPVGRNFYRVSVTFSSGLLWHSNRCAVTVNHIKRATAVHPNMLQSAGKVITLSLPPTDVSDISYIIPVHVSLSAATGHVRVELPKNATNAHYSLTFFDMHGRIIVDIPHAKLPGFLIDKRNFQQSGLYRFVLMCDGVLLESACIRLIL